MVMVSRESKWGLLGPAPLTGVEVIFAGDLVPLSFSMKGVDNGDYHLGLH